MNAAPKCVYVAVLAVSSFAFVACNNSSAPLAKFRIGGTVANLAGTAGGLVLEDNLHTDLHLSPPLVIRLPFPLAPCCAGPHN